MSGNSDASADILDSSSSSNNKPLGFKIIYMGDEEKKRESDKLSFPPPLAEPLNMALFLPVMTLQHINDIRESSEGGSVLDLSSMLFDQIDMLRFASECLTRLLSLPQDAFWSTLCYDRSVMRFVDSFLLHYRTYCDPEVVQTAPLFTKPEAKSLLEQISKRVLMVFMRISVRKESTGSAPSSGAASAAINVSEQDRTKKHRENEALMLAEAGIQLSSNMKKSVGLASFWVDEFGALKEDIYVELFSRFPYIFPLYSFFDLCAIYGSTNETSITPILARLLDAFVASRRSGLTDMKVLLDAEAAGMQMKERAEVLEQTVQAALESLTLTEFTILNIVSKNYINNKIPDSLEHAVDLASGEFILLTLDKVRDASNVGKSAGAAALASSLHDLTSSLLTLRASQRLFPREVNHTLSTLRAFPTFVRLFESTIPAIAFYLRLGQPGYRSSTSIAPMLHSIFELTKSYIACRIVEPTVEQHPHLRHLRDLVGAEFVHCMHSLVSTPSHSAPAFWLPPRAVIRLQDEAFHMIEEEKIPHVPGSTGSASIPNRVAQKMHELYPMLANSNEFLSLITDSNSTKFMSPYTEQGTLLYFIMRDTVAKVKTYISPRLARTNSTLPVNNIPVNVRLAHIVGGLVTNSMGLTSSVRFTADDNRLMRELSAQLPSSLPLLLQESSLQLLKRISQTTLPSLVDIAVLEAGSSRAREHHDSSVSSLLSTERKGSEVKSSHGEKKNKDPSLAELAEWIDSLQEMFPLYGPGFLEAVLQHVNWKVDAAVTLLLDETGKSLPKSLASIPERDKFIWQPKSTVAKRAEERDRQQRVVALEKSSNLAGTYSKRFEAKDTAEKAVQKGLLDGDEDEAFAEYLHRTGRTLKKVGTSINEFAHEAEREMLKMHIRRMLVDDEYEDEYDDALDGFDDQFIVDDDAEDREKLLSGKQKKSSMTNGKLKGKTSKQGLEDDEAEDEEDGGESTEDDEAEENKSGETRGKTSRPSTTVPQGGLDSKDLKVLERRKAALSQSQSVVNKTKRPPLPGRSATKRRGDDKFSLDEDEGEGTLNNPNSSGFPFGGRSSHHGFAESRGSRGGRVGGGHAPQRLDPISSTKHKNVPQQTHISTFNDSQSIQQSHNKKPSGSSKKASLQVVEYTPVQGEDEEEVTDASKAKSASSSGQKRHFSRGTGAAFHARHHHASKGGGPR